MQHIQLHVTYQRKVRIRKQELVRRREAQEVPAIRRAVNAALQLHRHLAAPIDTTAVLSRKQRRALAVGAYAAGRGECRAEADAVVGQHNGALERDECERLVVHIAHKRRLR